MQPNRPFRWLAFAPVVSVLSLILAGPDACGALLAYEPFTNAPGSDIIGSSGGSGFAGAWQANGSSGVATHVVTGLSYLDASSNALVTLGGAGFFQGLTSGNSSMQPIRRFDFSRGTNGVDGGTTWISFMIARQGPTGTLANNPYGRGANIPHDLMMDTLQQKLAIGNSSGASTNTIGLIPTGSSGNLQSSPVPFGGATNFVVVRIDHKAGANDDAYLFVNPPLDVEPLPGAADAVSAGGFDFSFNQLRVFAGGNNPTAQPYAEIVLDEYRLGESYADVTPHTTFSPPGPLVITHANTAANDILLSGTGGTPGWDYSVLGSTNLSLPASNWPVVGSNTFAVDGSFAWTHPMSPELDGRYFRLFVADQTPPAPVKPEILSDPTNLTVVAGQPAAFAVSASGTSPLTYQWFRNASTAVGVNSSNLTFAGVQGGDAGDYSVRVANAAGAVTSAVATLTVLLPPNITSQPQSLAVIVSNSALFNVTATGDGLLQYQWYFNTNTPLANATNEFYSIPTVLFSDAGTYSVRITNPNGAVTSLLAMLTVESQPAAADYYVSTSGSDSNPGTNVNAPFATLAKAVSVAGAGKLIYVRGGTYNGSSTVNLSKSGTPAQPIRIFAYPGESPRFDFSGQSTGSAGISISGNCWYLKGLEIANAGDNGIIITGKTNTVERCVLHDNQDSGLQLHNAGAAYNYILNCDSYRNFDPANNGENADGFAAKFTLGPGNVFSGCRSWENSDDGWDLWQATNSVVLTNCWTWGNGTNAWGVGSFAGDGNGIKLGGNNYYGEHFVYHCVSFKNPGNGFDQNNNTAGQTLYNNTAWANGSRNYHLSHGTNITPHVLCNNLSIAPGTPDGFTSGTLATNNSWQVLSPDASTSDVLSVDTALALSPRQADGSLPVVNFLRPVPAGRLVDAGVEVGLQYNGAAPDLGAMESP